MSALSCNQPTSQTLKDNLDPADESQSTRVVRPSGMVEYLNHEGEHHRTDGPAVERPDGTRYWYLHGKLHREDGPAIERADGTKEWHLNGKFHREGGPALEYPSGSKYWCRHGKPHREDGPAIDYFDGTKRWYLDGIELTEEEHRSQTEGEER